jgi:integration host factor subunit alpha
MPGKNIGVGTVTKADLVEAVYQRVGFSKKEAAAHVDLFFELVKKALLDGKKVKLQGFCTFIVKDKKGRVGRNPQTGEKIQIVPRRAISFKVSPLLRARVNGEDISMMGEEGEQD